MKEVFTSLLMMLSVPSQAPEHLKVGQCYRNPEYNRHMFEIIKILKIEHSWYNYDLWEKREEKNAEKQDGDFELPCYVIEQEYKESIECPK